MPNGVQYYFPCVKKKSYNRVHREVEKWRIVLKVIWSDRLSSKDECNCIFHITSSSGILNSAPIKRWCLCLFFLNLGGSSRLLQPRESSRNDTIWFLRWNHKNAMHFNFVLWGLLAPRTQPTYCDEAYTTVQRLMWGGFNAHWSIALAELWTNSYDQLPAI